MQNYTKVKIAYLKAKYNIWIITISTALFCILIIFAGKAVINNYTSMDNNNLLGIMGTLLGAIIGGSLTLVGSIYVNTVSYTI